jgi:hypothetical protein
LGHGLSSCDSGDTARKEKMKLYGNLYLGHGPSPCDSGRTAGKEKMKLIIDRKIWLRGEGIEDSYLLRSKDGKKCCIGILCSTLGVPDNELFNKRGAQRLINFELPAWLGPVTANNFMTELDIFRAYDANDQIGLPEDEREKLVAEIFARHDIEVEFVN